MKEARTIPHWNQNTKQLIGAALLIMSGLVIYRFRSLLPPVIIAALLAYVLAPIVGWISKILRVGRVWGTALLYLLGIAALATAPAISINTAVDEINKLELNFTDVVNQVLLWIEQFNQMKIPFAGREFVLPQIDLPTFDFQQIAGMIQNAVSTVAGGAFSVAVTVASGVGWVVFVAIITFYMIVDAERIGPSLLKLVPPDYREEVSKLGAQLNRTWNAFLRGEIILCLTIGFMTWLATTAIGLPYSIALGIVAGALEIIPSFGPVLASVPAIVIALVQGSSYIPLPNWGMAILVALVYWMIQSLENNLLVPRIIGASLNLHPLVVLIGILGGASLGGILGVLLAAPTLASLREIIHYLYCKVADVDPYPPPPTFAERMKKNGVRAFLFDLDGTLLDSDDMAVERWATWLRPVAFLDKLYDSKKLARRLIMALESPINGLITFLDVLGLDNLVLSMGESLRKIRAHRAPNRYSATLGAVALLGELGQYYDLGIVTTRNREDVQKFLLKFELQDVFKVIVTRQDVKRLKPHPESVRYAAKRLGLSPERCAMIGDTTVDVQAGKRAGALTVAVLCGFGERPELERLKPDLVLEITSQLPRHLVDPVQS
ncbi:MAG: AI-2E family transporter [Anaerolineae bacterium]|nr:AI-2E family transporter [Anaerolineae bacterium]